MQASVPFFTTRGFATDPSGLFIPFRKFLNALRQDIEETSGHETHGDLSFRNVMTHSEEITEAVVAVAERNGRERLVAGQLPSGSGAIYAGGGESAESRRFTGRTYSWTAGRRIVLEGCWYARQGLSARMPLLGSCEALEAQTKPIPMQKLVWKENGKSLIPCLAIDRRWEVHTSRASIQSTLVSFVE